MIAGIGYQEAKNLRVAEGFKKSKIESRTSYFKMRSYLDQLDVEQLQLMLEEFGN